MKHQCEWLLNVAGDVVVCKRLAVWRYKMDNELKWNKAFEEMQSGKMGALLRKELARAIKDKRHPSVPKWFDIMWSRVETSWLMFFIVPWSVFVSLDLGSQIWVVSNGSSPPTVIDGWGLVLLLAKASTVGALSLGSVFSLSIASKTSWRARWGGPKECREAQSLAAREPLCRQWLDEALPRGLRCIDLEAMRYINRRQQWVSGHKAMRASELATKNQELKAYEEMNQRAMEALSEARVLSDMLGKKESSEKPSARRL